MSSDMRLVLRECFFGDSAGDGRKEFVGHLGVIEVFVFELETIVDVRLFIAESLRVGLLLRLCELNGVVLELLESGVI